MSLFRDNRRLKQRYRCAVRLIRRLDVSIVRRLYGARRCGFLIDAPNGDEKRNYVTDVVMATWRLVLVLAA